MDAPGKNNVLVAILAAGESRRMGRPKLCLPWGETTILGHIIDLWKKADVDNLLVVHPSTHENPVIQELNRLSFPHHQRVATLAPERGMMGSVVTAAHHALYLPSFTHLIIALGDQPQIHPQTLSDLLVTCTNRPHSIIRMVHLGEPAHPVALPSRLFHELRNTHCETLRDFLSQHLIDIFDLTSHDSGVLLDVDTPDDYDRANRAAK